MLKRSRREEELGKVYISVFDSWEKTLARLLKASNTSRLINENQTILIKPNLVEAFKPPITTPVEAVAALIDCIRDSFPGARIVVGEGTASLHYDTPHVFQVLGYVEMARGKNVELVDLNEEPLIPMSREDCGRWPQMFLPRLVMESYLISVPVLKAHSLAGVTLTMKNMIGCAPPSYFQCNGHWKKASFHKDIHDAIFDLNKYRKPDLTILDATRGMRDAHLWGPECDPPPYLVAVSHDCTAIDGFGAGLLKKNWRDVGHIRMAHQVLGIAEPLDTIFVEQ